jgi:hypothetical protein
MKATTGSINAVRRILEAGRPMLKKTVLSLLEARGLTQADFTTTSQRLLTTDDLELRAILFAVQDM